MITVAELKGLAANKALSIGEAWNALDAAAERIEYMENWLRPIVERMRLEAHVHQRTNPIHAKTLEAFAMDVESSFANAPVSVRRPERTVGPVGDREYCLICRREIMTESGHVCSSCANMKTEGLR